MKYIVTHFSPDLDAITSCWLVKKYFPGWQNAKIKFVSAGSTLNNLPADSNLNILHVDTGLGKFDHHQTDSFTCSAKKIFQYLIKKNLIKKKSLKEALSIIIDYVNQIDHFLEVNFYQPTSNIYDFCLHQLIEGLKPVLNNEEKLMELGFKLLDSALQILTKKINAKEEIKKGLIFESFWGKTLALESRNEEAVKLALKMGFNLVIRRDPKRKIIRIKLHPNSKNDLTPLFQKIINLDKKGDWFLHSSKKMLLNGSSKNPDLKPTSLSLLKIIEIIKKL